MKFEPLVCLHHSIKAPSMQETLPSTDNILFYRTDCSQCLRKPVLSMHWGQELQKRDCEQLPNEPSFDGADNGGHRTKWQTLSLLL